MENDLERDEKRLNGRIYKTDCRQNWMPAASSNPLFDFDAVELAIELEKRGWVAFKPKTKKGRK